MKTIKIFYLMPLAMIISLFGSISARAQFTGCSTGLLQMPTAEMQVDGAVMITSNWLNMNSLPSSGWDYSTFQYGVAISFWGRLEIGYVCTIFDGRKTSREEQYWRIMLNQDRHFSGRVQLLREGEFGVKWIPALVVGVCDPTSGAGGDYVEGNTSGSGNGYFNRNFVVLSKHLKTTWGTIGVHAGYQFNHRTDYQINAPCVGVNWLPRWLHERGVLDDVNLIVEYDSRTVNIGFIVSVWDNRFEAMFELQNFQWINFGLRYKLFLKKDSFNN